MAISPGTKNLTVNMEEELYKEVKLYCVKNDIKIKDYVIALIKKDLDNKKAQL